MRRIYKILLGIILIISISFSTGLSKSNKKILMIIAHQNFRDEELLIPKKLFEIIRIIPKRIL
jgi:protease I